MDAPGLLVVLLGLVSMAGLVLGVLGWQRAALTSGERDAARARVEELERAAARQRVAVGALSGLVDAGDTLPPPTVAARRGTVGWLVEASRAGWRGETFTARGTVKVRGRD